MSRIDRENKKYLARVEKSMQMEKDAAQARQQRREAREQEQIEREKYSEEMAEMRRAQQDDFRRAKIARDERITNVNNNYGTFWCTTVGTSLRELVHNIKNGVDQKPATRSMRLKVYDSKAKNVDARSMLDMLNLIVGDGDMLPELPETNGQVRWCGDLYVSSTIYEFVRCVWNDGKIESNVDNEEVASSEA